MNLIGYKSWWIWLMYLAGYITLDDLNRLKILTQEHEVDFNRCCTFISALLC